MTEVRKNERYYINASEEFLVQVEPNKGRLINCFLNDISSGGACIIVDREVFLQRDKHYPFQIFQKRPNGELERFANTMGKIVWYLSKEFKEQEMIYLGIKFQEQISLPSTMSSKAEVSV
jgi:hypothetical protein